MFRIDIDEHEDSYSEYLRASMTWDELAEIIPKERVEELQCSRRAVQREEEDEGLLNDSENNERDARRSGEVAADNATSAVPSKDPHPTRIGTIVKHLLIMAKAPVKWSRVICDEAQLVRRESSGLNRLVRMIPKDFVHLISATPALNHVRDYRGHFSIL